MNVLKWSSLVAMIAMIGYGAPANALISDDFEVDSSASYTILDDGNAPSGDGTADSTSTFAYDYIAAGLPLAPNSAAGDTNGLRFTVNDTAGAADHITAFHNTAVSGSIRMDVDIYMNIGTGGGTTEFTHVGIGSDATDFNSIFTPIAGDGHFLSMTGDGGSGSDYRHFVEGTPVNDGDLSYLNDLNTTNAPGDTYQTLFPNTQFPGSPGNTWTTLTITATPDVGVVYWLDGTPIIKTALADSDGQVSLGLTDVFSSVGAHSVIFDNLSVTQIPEPASALLALLALTGVGCRRRGC